MALITKLIREKDWDTLKRVSPYFYSLKRDLAVKPTGCVLYDNRLMVPSSLKQLVINSLNQTHPCQTGMLRLADLVWSPRIHRDVTAKAQSCAQVIKDCDTQTALNYTEEYCRFHGFPGSLRCDQAQALKTREFEIFCKNKNITLILAPAGDHRATGMVERLIQTKKRRIAVMEHDPLWSSSNLAKREAKKIESIRLIPNTTTRIKPFEAHFGRPPNKELSDIITKPSSKNLSYKQIKNMLQIKRPSGTQYSLGK